MRLQAICAALLAALALSACGKNEAQPGKQPSALPPTNVTVTSVVQRDIEVVEETVGTVEGPIAPQIMAEVAGRVTKAYGRAGAAVKEGELLAIIDPADLKLQREVAQAEVARIAAELAKQDRVVERTRQLIREKFVSEAALDDALSLQKALREQLEGARASVALIDRSVGKTQVRSPLDGRIDRPIVSEGDYVKIGDPMFALVSARVLNVYLPFPESAAARLRPGQPVRLITPAAPDRPIDATLSDIKPVVGDVNRAVNALVRLRDVVDWRPGATVTGSVVVDVRRNAVVVPEGSVVLRPAGKVVYEVAGDKAVQHVVTTGVKSGGLVEILTGLTAGQKVAVDGAGFLTDQAPVKVTAEKPPR
jgi:RND family efflux transporter MFP subunit